MDTLLFEEQFYTSWDYFGYFWLNYNLVIRGMNNHVMQMQLELNIEKMRHINIENLVVNVLLKKRVKKKEIWKDIFSCLNLECAKEILVWNCFKGQVMKPKTVLLNLKQQFSYNL